MQAEKEPGLRFVSLEAGLKKMVHAIMDSINQLNVPSMQMWKSMMLAGFGRLNPFPLPLWPLK